MTDDLLELSALTAERKQVPLRWPENPEGVMVELASRNDFGSFDHAELDRMRLEFAQLRLLKEPSEAQKNRAAQVLNDLVRRLIIGGPDEAIRALPDATKEDVAERFFGPGDLRLLPMLQDLDEETMEKLVRLGMSSQDSKDSTEATPNAGDE